MSVSDFNNIYRIPRLREALENVAAELHTSGTVSQSNSEIRLLRNETAFLNSTGIIQPFEGTDSLKPGVFSENLARKLSLWLNAVDSGYRRLSNLADMSLDNYVSSNKMALDLLYNNYHNDKLEEIVRKVYEKSKMLEFRDRLIQNADLIYLEPVATGPLGFRTHFMAPVKKFMGLTVGTFRFNILLVLSSLIVLYILLYHGTLRRLIMFFENTGFEKRRKRNRK
jgi:hypothetical protein